ncbi:hypothetical protein HJC23_003653 [Cyclotella cryptica]|uniref:Xrn1 N-terminal domain-containing protein n=1 Tax=Cyclotella cryptica TaxID=29204 RepID=A0ABD3QJN4_9STRA|eukprot:CCRYP_004942-RA/>CCRYP_004942-RA protein AED:0.02 eAED:0.02 QI:253/1/1/1/0.8/0.66/6/580/985
MKFKRIHTNIATHVVTSSINILPSAQLLTLYLIFLFDSVHGAKFFNVWNPRGALREKCCFVTTNSQMLTSIINVKSEKDERRVNNGFLYSVNHRHWGQRRYDHSLYGIKGFRSWFEATFPSSMVTVDAPDVDWGHPTKRITPTSQNPTEDNKHVSTSLPQVYDHVLVDANQYLHSTLRRAYNRMAKKRQRNNTLEWDKGLDDETIELSLAFLLRELDHLVTTVAIPRKSVVIALDGSPGAAKLDMQRRRRFGIYRKAEMQQKLITILKERGWTDKDFGISSSTNVKGIENIILAKHDREQITLSISPGTAYMDRVTNAVIYWAWKCMSKRHWPIEGFESKSSHQVKIYISPSNVPGEGEVKLLDWLMRGHHSTKTKNHQALVKMGESVAIIGGDSDLVLMGMVIPPSVTHNISILLPREMNKTSFYIVSMWESTKALAKYLTGEDAPDKPRRKKKQKKQDEGMGKKITLGGIKHAKLDLVLLIIMTGNDYLPKVRGVGGGFEAFFATYVNLVKSQLEKNGRDADSTPFMIAVDDDDRLSINVPFAISFFRNMLKFQPPRLLRLMEEGNDNSQFELGLLHNLVEASILPSPMEFQTIRPGDNSYFKAELWQLSSKLNKKTPRFIKDVYGHDVEIVRLTLGKYPIDEAMKGNTTVLGQSDGHGVISRMIPAPGNNDNVGRSYLFEVPHRQGGALKGTKHRLACLALNEIFGSENMDVFGYDNSDIDGDDDVVELDYSKTERVQSDVKSYLGGLLWTLETYQKGHCADYGYNYGQRAAPAVFQILDFLESVERDGIVHLHRTDLIEDTALPPLTDGLSCLAALPSQAWHLVPEPYNQLLHPSNSLTFDEMYRSCVDPTTNVFDMGKFQRICASSLRKSKRRQKLSKANSHLVEPDQKDNKKSGASSERHIYTGSKYWTVISKTKDTLQHPFTPPKAYTSRAPALRGNRRIKASKLPVAPGQHFRKSTASSRTQTDGAATVEVNGQHEL